MLGPIPNSLGGGGYSQDAFLHGLVAYVRTDMVIPPADPVEQCIQIEGQVTTVQQLAGSVSTVTTLTGEVTTRKTLRGTIPRCN